MVVFGLTFDWERRSIMEGRPQRTQRDRLCARGNRGNNLVDEFRRSLVARVRLPDRYSQFVLRRSGVVVHVGIPTSEMPGFRKIELNIAVHVACQLRQLRLEQPPSRHCTMEYLARE